MYRLRLPYKVAAFCWEATRLWCGVFDEELTAIASRSLNVASAISAAEAVDILRGSLKQLASEAGLRRTEIAGVAVSLNAVRIGARSLASSVLPWADESIGQRFADGLKLPVRVVLHSAPIAEYSKLPDPPPRAICLLRAGDGVSARTMDLGQVLVGRHSLAGELGHVTAEAEGPLCGCGRRGCLETFCSGPAIRAKVLEGLQHRIPSELAHAPMERLSAYQAIGPIWRAWSAGDSLARAVMETVLDRLGWGLGLVVNLFDPDLVVAGGYVLKGHEQWIEEIQRRSQRWILHAAKRQTPIVSAQAESEDQLRVTACVFHPLAVADEVAVPQGALGKGRGSRRRPSRIG